MQVSTDTVLNLQLRLETWLEIAEAQIAQLREQLAAVQKRVAELEAENKMLKPLPNAPEPIARDLGDNR